MLLRRVSKHVKEQNWFAVGIDLVIVVVGVFIGIQVANWNDAQADKRLGRYYVERLKEDLEGDLQTSTSLFEYYDQVLESVVAADRLLSTDGPDAKAVVVAAYRASEFNNNPTNSATWDQIVSSGHIGLLPSVAVERGLSEYYKYQASVDASNLRIVNSPYRLAVRSLTPLPVQLAIREGCSDVFNATNNATRFVSECVLDVANSELTKAADALVSSRTVREALRHQYSLVAYVRLNQEANMIQVREVLDALHAEQ